MEQVSGSVTDDEMLSFQVLTETARIGPRLGELLTRARPAISTPSFVACTSRGVLPHVTPDLMLKHTALSAVYIGLEDFVEKPQNGAPILSAVDDNTTTTTTTTASATLHRYTSLPERYWSILGARRTPRLSTPHQNTNSALSLSTSSGFSHLEVADYDSAVSRLKPDIATTAVDLVQADKINKKRLEKSADRTHAWLRDTLDRVDSRLSRPPLFASIPPLEAEQQSFYLADLADDFKHQLSGLCVYESATVSVVPDSLRTLPVLCLSDPRGPHDLLHAISLGVDLITTPFVTTASEGGIALTFKFSPPDDTENGQLGIDLWSMSHKTDLVGLVPSCVCYTCQQHHRAYVNHLLQAKEMLAWTLLQIHNTHVVDQFFQHVRASISRGTFEKDSQIFRNAYSVEMPHKTGEGPRIRGYQIKSMGPGESKKNTKAYNRFGEQALKIQEAEAGIASPAPEADGGALEDQGLGRRID